MRGIICLDIDGTVTSHPDHIPKAVISCLHKLFLKGWGILFATGRTFSYAHLALKDLPFPYYFTVQNGADLLQMPEKKLLKRNYLTHHTFKEVESLARECAEGFLVYSGLDLGDFCYYKEKDFSPLYQQHNERLKKLSKSPWVEGFSFTKEQEFPLIKVLGKEEEMRALHHKLCLIKNTETTLIKDPVDAHIFLNLVTAKGASKGVALHFLRKKLPQGIPFIAAGDDHNDISMLKEADGAIVMETAPKEMYFLGDIIAKSAIKEGIIEALEKLTEKLWDKKL